MKNAPFISIIIPAYNAQDTIVDCINSAVKQSYEKLEVIVVNDGSIDNTEEIVTGTNDPRIKYFYQQNAGACRVRNVGIEKSKGDFIQFLDADDLLHPDKIRFQVEQWQTNHNESLIVSANWDRFVNDPDECEFPTRYLDKDWENPIDWLINAWEGKGMIAQHAWLVPKHLIEKAGPWDERLKVNQDGEFFSRVLLLAKEIKFCPEAKVYYRSTGNESVSEILTEEKASSLLLSYQLYKKNSLPHEDSPRVRHALMMNFLDFIYRFNGKYPTLAYHARMEIKDLGFDQLPLVGGRYFRKLAAVIGTEYALMLRKTILRY